jgi:hypothetical protein
VDIYVLCGKFYSYEGLMASGIYNLYIDKIAAEVLSGRRKSLTESVPRSMQWRDRQIRADFNHGGFGIFNDGIAHHCVVNRLKFRCGGDSTFIVKHHMVSRKGQLNIR